MKYFLSNKNSLFVMKEFNCFEVFVFAMKVHRVPSIPVVASALFALVGGLTTLWTIVFFYDH